MLVVEPHPDDLAWGVGGSVAKWSEEHEIYSLCLTEGVTAGHLNEGMRLVEYQRAEERKEQCLRANGILGVKETFFADLPDMKLNTVSHTAINRHVERVIGEVKPKVVFCPWVRDLNKDHLLTYESTMVAARRVKNVVCYETPSTKSFQPNLYVDITETFRRKIKALKQYPTEFSISNLPYKSTIDYARTVAKYHGFQVNVKYAEAFRLEVGFVE